LIQSHNKEPDIVERNNKDVEVTVKKEAPAAKWVGFIFILKWKFIFQLHRNFLWKTLFFSLNIIIVLLFGEVAVNIVD
jgi:hypothetical protein